MAIQLSRESFEEVVKPISEEIEVSAFYGAVIDKTQIGRLLKYLGTEYPLPENVSSDGTV